MAEEFDIGPLTWVKDEIGQALKSVLDNLVSFAENPSDSSVLRFSGTHLYQVSGALDMVGLQGCKRFCAEIEHVVAQLENQSLVYSEEIIEKLKQSIKVLDEYLQSLLNGAPDLPLKLFPALQALVNVQGQSIEESELFFPDTSLRAPKDLPSQEVAEADLPKYYATQRSIFQKALLEWLKTSSTEALDGMQRAVENVQQVQKQTSLKTLWWVTSAFTDVLNVKEIAEAPSVKRLYRQIDQQIKGLSEGSTKTPTSLLRDLLYYIAVSPVANEKVARVKDIFELQDYLPPTANSFEEELEFAPAELTHIKEMLLPLKNIWAKVTIGNSDEIIDFSNQFTHLLDSSKSLNHQLLQDLISAMHALSQKLSDDVDNISEDAIIEMATSLNLLDDAIQNNAQPSNISTKQISDQIQRLRSMIGDVGGGDYSPAIEQGQQDNEVVSAVAKQIKEALLLIEKALDSYFRNPEQIEVLQDTNKPMQQVIAAFDMLDMPVPMHVAKCSASYITLFSDDSQPHEEKASYFELVAESLSLLGFYVDELPKVRPETLQVLEAALGRLDKQSLTPETETTDENVVEQSEEIEAVPAIETVAPAQRAFDADMLEIYLEEAEEVLASVAQNLQALRVNITDSDALSEVRRGYHTLKGSGRMVGLNSLGDVAWCVEKMLNKTIEHKQTLTPKQLAFIEKVSGAFAEWVAELRATSEASLNAGAWQAEAEALENDSQQQKPQAEEVLIDGTRKMSRTLFNIFMGEAKQHLQVLKQELANLSLETSEKPNNAFIRSAHTLASNAGATGFTTVLNLARAFENWLDVHDGRWTEKSLKLAGNVVSGLSDMLDVVESLRQPKRATGLLNALKKATAEAQQVEEFIPAEEQAVTNDLEILEAIEVTSEMISPEALPQEDLEPNTVELNEAITETPIVEDVIAVIHPEVTAPQIAEPEVTDPLNKIKTAKNVNAIDQELHTIFLEEAKELVPQIGKELRAWRTEPQDNQHPDELQRVLHTLKGSARMAGQSSMGNTVHGMEDRIIKALQGKVTDLDFDDLFTDLDKIGHLLEDASGSELAEKNQGKNQRVALARNIADEGITRSNERRAQYLRLRADVLDRLINEAGEISIARARMSQEMLGFKQLSLDLTENVMRLRNYLRELEIETESQMQSRMTLLQEAQEAFDPLEFDRFTRLQELTRLMAESVNDVSTIQHSLLMNLDETESALQQQNRMNRELQHGLMDVRMVPFSQISERLQRIVRQTARELKKQVELHIDGEDVDIDRSVLDRIGAPLEHLLRNAVAHGLETSAERKKSGKPLVGNITLKVRHENDEISLTVSDDGAGVNLQKVKEKAIKNGLFAADQAVNDQALLSVIFEPGFSTADNITQIAGRGVGLDAVRGDITALGGRIDVSNAGADGVANAGAVFSIYLPVTLTVAQVVMIRAGTHVFALPSIMVEQLQKLKQTPLAETYQKGYLDWSGRQYPVHFFTKLIGDNTQSPEAQTYSPILLLRSGTYHIALHVDEIVGNQEIVMKPIGTQLSRVPGIAGATVLGDGRIVLIVNPVQLANRESLAAGSVKVHVAEPVLVNTQRVAMVVDDSLTMRKVLGRLLERENYHVLVAKDGMDALQVLQEHTPDIILSDIEMPRMDGFEFVRNVRADEKHKNVPIIMISSRTAEKHQNHAKELGVNAFLGKPVGDDELIGTMDKLLNPN